MSPGVSPTQRMSTPVHHNRQPSTSRPQYYYPTVPSVQQPTAAYVGYPQRLSETQRTDTTRVQSSISSGDSGSSAFSYQKHPPSPWQSSPTQEQPIMDGDPDRHRSQWERTDRQSPRHSPARQEMVEGNSAVMRYLQEQQQQIESGVDQDDGEEDHALWVLFWLSCLDPFHSMFTCLFTIITTFVLALVSPIQLCHKQMSFGDRLVRILAPLYRNHLQLMYATAAEDAFSFEFKPMALVFVHLGAPFLSFSVMIAAWISAAFWIFAFIMGNPDGTERRDDGRDAVLAVRNWWEVYFLNALKPEDHAVSTV